jgi:hypothetical protein
MVMLMLNKHKLNSLKDSSREKERERYVTLPLLWRYTLNSVIDHGMLRCSDQVDVLNSTQLWLYVKSMLAYNEELLLC